MKGIMKNFYENHRTLLPFYAAVIIVLAWGLFFFRGSWSELWITNDQKGYQLFETKQYTEAADTFDDVSYKGASFYRAGEFKKAKALYMTNSSKEGRYNLGNSHMMLGKYKEAIEAYEIALKIDPNFTWAKENRTLALARQAMLDVENDGQQGVGALGADEIVYDNTENKGQDVTEEGSGETSESRNANWLDRIQTGPKDFLKHKFSYQYGMQKGKDAK
ncbi:MAG: tetratricopeptide repeat protein [Campylobacterota bacterium]|nr:tetratricopeptide repeat protein [Campylobacterota bacterium]